METKFSGTAVILAGGQGRRMQGELKAFLQVGGISILDRLRVVLESMFEGILLVVKSKDQLIEDVKGVTVVLDQYSDQSAMTGIHAGLSAAETERVFVVACDMPFLEAEAVQKIWLTSETSEIVVPEWQGRYQPLCATYKKACLKEMELLLQEKNFKVENLFSKVATSVISATEMEKVDPEGKSFINVNRPEDLKMAQLLMEEVARAR